MRALIVEDEPKLARLIQRGLQEEGYAADVAGTGEDALWMARASPYDAIVLDVMLPAADGFEVCRELRDAGVWAPVLMLTARDAVEDRIEGLDTGADDYLKKPFSFPVLLARIRSLVRRVGHRDVAPSTIGSLTIDSLGRRVWAGDTEVELTRREFDVLEYLARRPGQVASKDDIISGVWEFDFDGDPNIVEVYIGRLRRKIDDPFGTHHLTTVRRAGYRLDHDG
jgi:two-component system, OmpR family, response regulator